MVQSCFLIFPTPPTPPTLASFYHRPGTRTPTGMEKKVFETSSDDKKRDDTYYDDLEKMNIEELELQFKINLINTIKHIQDVSGVRTYEVPELLSKVNSFSVKEVKRMEKHIEKRAESRRGKKDTIEVRIKKSMAAKIREENKRKQRELI